MTGNAPTTSEWSPIWLHTKVRRILEVWQYMPNVVHFVEASVYYRNDSIAWCIQLFPPIAVMSHEHHSISNHQQLDCMINRLFRLTSKKTPKFCASLIPWWGGSPSVDFPHKGPVMQKVFPCHDITVECCCNMVQYDMILHTPCRNWGRISIRGCIHKRHPIPRPDGRAMGCLSWIFWPRDNGTALYHESCWDVWECDSSMAFTTPYEQFKGAGILCHEWRLHQGVWRGRLLRKLVSAIIEEVGTRFEGGRQH